MKKITVLLLIIITSLSSCNKDDDNSSLDKIVGTWLLYKEVDLTDNSVYISGAFDEKDIFNSDGTGIGYVDNADCGCYPDKGWPIAWKNLGNGNYNFTVIGFAVTSKVDFIGNDEMTIEHDDWVSYFRRE